LARAQKYGVGFHEYMNWQQDNTVVIVQIEHINAVKKVRDILNVDGVDGFIIGPYDLSGSMGIPGQFDHPDFLEAVKTITEVAKELKKPGGIHVVEPNPEEVSNAIDQGHKFIAYSVDIRMLDNMCRDVFIKTQALK
jgi:2-dehydro-3-deoxyglucarate aldolase